MLTVLVAPFFSAYLLIYLFRPTKPMVWQKSFVVKNSFHNNSQLAVQATKECNLTIFCHSSNGNCMSERVWRRTFFLSLSCKSLSLKKIQQNNKRLILLILFMLLFCALTSHKQANVFGAGLFHFNGNVDH